MRQTNSIAAVDLKNHAYTHRALPRPPTPRQNLTEAAAQEQRMWEWWRAQDLEKLARHPTHYPSLTHVAT